MDNLAKLRLVLEYYAGFHGTDATLRELHEELESLIRTPDTYVFPFGVDDTEH